MSEEIIKLQLRKVKLLQAIEDTKKKKEKITLIVQGFVKELNSGRITRKEYEEKLSSALKKRTAEQWIKYYDDYIKYYNYQIKLCERLISEAKEKEKLETKKLKKEEKKFVKKEEKKEKPSKEKITIYEGWEKKPRKRKLVPVLIVLIAVVLIAIFISVSVNLKPAGINVFSKIGEKISTTINQFPEKAPEAEKPEEIPTSEFEEPILPVILEDKTSLIKEESLIQYQAVIGKPVKWKKQFTVDSITGFSVELPKGSENIEGNSDGKDITEITSISKKRNFFFFGEKAVEVSVNTNSITGNAIADENTESISYEIAYETPAPVAEEEIIGMKKRITITGPDDVHYKNILSFAELPRELDKTELGKLKLYQVEKDGVSTRTETKFTAYDTNENGLYDYIKWITPGLSEAVYEISISVLNIQSYPTVGGNWKVEFETTGTADLTIKPIDDTAWSNENEDNDLKFLEIRCGENILDYEWTDDSVFIENYFCNETGSELSKVLTPREHDLEFDFGGEKAYAHNYAMGVGEGWTAFNDFAQNVSGLGSNQSFVTNISRQTTPLVYNNNGSLKNYGTGAILPINLTMEKADWNTVAWPNCWDCIGGMANPETDFYNLLFGRVNATGIFGYQNGEHKYRFDRLNSSKKYRVVIFLNRFNDADEGRNTTIIIQGADSFRANPSIGVTKINSTNMTNDTITFGVGSNTAEGYIASWTNISAGSDGSFYINITNTTIYTGSHSYGANAIMLEELPEIPADAYTFVVIPDPQDYLKDNVSFQYQREMQWIVDHKDALNIKFVIGVGDIVENQTSLSEWRNASLAWKKLDNAGIPNSVLPGNHEHVGWGWESSATPETDDNNISANFNKYFNVSRYNSTSWWGGNYNNLTNSYYNLTINGVDYIFLSLGWCPTQAEVDWANDTFTSFFITHPNGKGIFSTHGYLDETTNSTQGDNENGEGVNNCNRYSPAGNFGNTTYIWDMIKTHPNVQIVLCGHEHDGLDGFDGEVRRTDLNDAEKPVYQMLSDFQDFDNGGNGYIRLLIVVPSENKIYVKTASTNLLNYKTDYESQFVLNYEIEVGVDTTAPAIWFEDSTSNSTITENNILVNVSASDVDRGNNNISTFIDFDNSLTGWWRMDAHSGNIVYDNSSYGNNGTIFGATYDSSGKLGGSYYFNGTISNYISANISSIQGLTNFTFSVWFKSSNMTDRYIFSGALGPNPDDDQLTIGFNLNDRVRVFVYNRIYFYDFPSLIYYNDSNWHQLVVTRNYNNLSCYIDNSLLGSVISNSDPISVAESGFIIGQDQDDVGGGFEPTQSWNGSLDDIMIFKRALNKQEVAALYVNQTSRYLFVNFTNLAFGNHTFIAYAQDTAGNVNMTETKEVIILGREDVANCIDLTQANTIYTMVANIPNPDLTGKSSCINITAQNITLDCDGKYIKSSSNASGVYSDQLNTIIKNCNITMGSGIGGNGIFLDGANNSYVFNNTLALNNQGIILLNAFSSKIENNTANSGDKGIVLVGSRNNNITNNNISKSNYGIFLVSSSDSNIIIANTISNSSTGIALLPSSNSNIIIANTISNSSTGIYFIESSHNIIKDTNISFSNSNDTLLTQFSTNNTFLNVRYNISKESVSSYPPPPSSLIRKWYYQANVSYNGIPVNNATILVYDKTGIPAGLQFNLTSNSSGLTNRVEIIDYINTGITNYYSLYTIYTTNGSLIESHKLNVTNKTLQSGFGGLIFDVFTLSKNLAPNITWVENIGNVLPLGGKTQNVNFKFTAYDANGFDDLNDNSAKANFSKIGYEQSRTSLSCVRIANFNTYYANYSCTVGMLYFDEGGNWNISVSIEDNSNLLGINDSTTFHYDYLTAISNPSLLDWGVLAPGDINKPVIGNPIIANNTGNVDIPVIKINGTNLINGIYFIGVGNFSVNISDGYGSGALLVNNASVIVTNSSLPSKNFSSSGERNLYFYIKQVPYGLPSLDYQTDPNYPWIIGFAVLLSIKRKKKKIVIPLIIFKLEISPAEALCKYLRENKELSVGEITKLINRDKSTISINYKNAVKRTKEKFKDEGDLFVDVSIFSNRKLSVLESLISYLKKKGYRNYEIAELLNKDQRNISTLYSRVNRKLKRELIEKKEIVVPVKIFRYGGSGVLYKYLRENIGLRFNEIARLTNREDSTVWMNYRNVNQRIKKIKEEDEITISIKAFSNRKLSVLEMIVNYLKKKGMRNCEIANMLNKDQRVIGTLYSRVKRKLK